MKVTFIGVGEALDEHLPNNSHLITAESALLLDCGYSIPQQIWQYNKDPDFLDAIYITHPHADHYFGLPALLTRMNEDKRTKPLTIICHHSMEKQIRDVIDMGYRGIMDKFQFEVSFLHAKTGEEVRFNEFIMHFAPVKHAVFNLGITVTDGINTVFYSGDGLPTEESKELMQGCDLVIHEAYTLDDDLPVHANVMNLIRISKENNVGCLALTHMQRDFRRRDMDKVQEVIDNSDLKIIVPEPLDTYFSED